MDNKDLVIILPYEGLNHKPYFTVPFLASPTQHPRPNS